MNTTDRFHDAIAVIATRRTARAITLGLPRIGGTQGTRAERERAGIDRLARDLRICGRLWNDDHRDVRPAA